MTQTANSIFQPFLQFEINNNVGASSTVVEGSVMYNNDHSSTKYADANKSQPRSPIPVARLAAVKDAARQAYLESMKDTSSPKKGQRQNFSASAPPTVLAGRRAKPKEDSGVSKPFHLREGTYISQKKTGTGKASDTTVDTAVMRRANDPKKILYSIFPPQEVSEENVEEDSVSPDERKSTVVRVSAQPASREDVTALHRAMIQRLELRRAKPTGLCAIRREVYEDVFSEVIRQVTLEEPARGVLLQRLRDELHQSLLLHSNLRNRADYFASRKQNADRSSEEDLKKRIAALEAEKREIEARKAALRKQQAEMNKRYEQERFKRNKDEQEELQYLRRTNQQLSIRLKMETERVSGATGGGGATAE